MHSLWFVLLLVVIRDCVNGGSELTTRVRGHFSAFCPWLGKQWAAPQAPATVTSSLWGLLPWDLDTKQTSWCCFCRACYHSSRRDLRYCPVALSFNWFIFSDVNVFCLSKINRDWNLCLLVKGPWSLFVGIVWHSRWTGDCHGLPWQNAGPCPLARIWWHPQHVVELPHLPGGGQQWKWHRLRWLFSSPRYPASLPHCYCIWQRVTPLREECPPHPPSPSLSPWCEPSLLPFFSRPLVDGSPEAWVLLDIKWDVCLLLSLWFCGNKEHCRWKLLYY